MLRGAIVIQSSGLPKKVGIIMYLQGAKRILKSEDLLAIQQYRSTKTIYKNNTKPSEKTFLSTDLLPTST
ncbi:MAG: hypothetical protein NVS4B7_09090 [Ktedonobacteraceae bacterium]